MNNISFYLNNLIIKNRLLSEDELKDFQPFIVNKFLYYSGFHRQAEKFNFYIFHIPKLLAYRLMYYNLPRILYFKFDYKKKEVNSLYPEFYLKAISQYFKVSIKRAEEYARILDRYPEKKLEFISLFPFSKEELKTLGVSESDILSKRFKKPKKANRWW